MMFDWAYSGANKAVPRNVGPECAYYLSFQRQIIETLVVTAISVYILVITYPKLCVPHEGTYLRSDRGGKRLLLIVFTLLWGMEIGFKFASRTVIYLLNPCHVTTLIQIYLLSAPPSKTVTTIFRIHLNLLNGPLLAFLFPETASRKIFAEAALYWIQHGMMFVIPYYLLRIGGVYNVEPLWDFNWAIFSYCLNLMYHFIILQPIAIPAQVNLNHMLCPAILDPFEGPWYRFAAVLHQAMLCPLLCKLYCLLAEFCLTKFPPTKVKPQMKDHLTDDTSLIVEGFIRRKSRGLPISASVMLAIRMPRHGSGARVVLRSMDLYAEVSDACKQRDPGCAALSQQLGCDCQDQKVTVTGD